MLRADLRIVMSLISQLGLHTSLSDEKIRFRSRVKGEGVTGGVSVKAMSLVNRADMPMVWFQGAQGIYWCQVGAQSHQ
jgi:hypothetical protein